MKPLVLVTEQINGRAGNKVQDTILDGGQEIKQT